MNFSYHLDVGCQFLLEIEQRRNSPGEIVMVILRPDDKILLMTKSFYPGSVYRLPTGKMKANEDADLAFAREIKEETGFISTNASLSAIVDYTLRCEKYTTVYRSFIYITDVISDDPVPEDEDEGITDFKEIEYAGLLEVAQELRRMQPGRWNDWGHFRAIAHEVVYKLLAKDKGQER